MTLIPIIASSQDLTKKLSKQICKCLEKNDVTSLEEMNPCFESVIVKNIENMYKYYNVKTMDEIDFDKIGNGVGAELVKECDYIIPYLTDPKYNIDKDYPIDKNLDCSNLRNGEFYYLNSTKNSNVNDTTFVSINENVFMERMRNGRTYSFLDIVWKDDCRFDLIFKQSNDPFKSELSKVGDKYEYEMIASTPSSYIIKMKWKEQEYKFELFSIQ